MPDRIGQQLGNYQLLHLLGEGGFAQVYLGEHIHLGTQAAIKVLHTQLTKNDVDTFRAEARIIARLIHPHIVRVLDFGIEGTTPYLIMDYAQGGTLRQHHPKGGPLPLSLVVDYVGQVAEALQYAHDRNLIHRDLKPENLLVGENGKVLLSDFGIAALAHSTATMQTAIFAGTLPYSAPEQIQGKPRRESDQYTLGIIVYEWLTGERPFHGSLTELIGQHLAATPPSLQEKVSTISPEVNRIVQRALAKDPKQRFESVQAMACALRDAAHHSPSTTTVSTPTINPRMAASTLPPEPVFQPSSSGPPLVSEPSLTETKSAHREPATQTSDTGVSLQMSALASHSPPPNHHFPFPQSRHQRIALVLILLSLILVGAGSLGIYASIINNQTIVHPLGETRTSRPFGTSQNLYSIAWSSSQFVAVGGAGTILTSPDGSNWTSRPSGTSQNLWSIVWSNSQFVAVGWKGTILTSPDGISWTSRTSGTLQYLWSIAWSNSQFVAVGSAGTILTSPDGSNWTSRPSGTSQDLESIAWSNSQFVAVGSAGIIFTSPDGINWTSHPSGVSQTLVGIAWSRSQFVAVGLNGAILTSPDGINWTSRPSGTSQDLESIAWSNSQFVAVGGAGTILTSPDGINWTSRPSGTSQTLVGITSSSSQFVAVGLNGTILTSP